MMKYIIPYQIFENEDNLPHPQVIWEKYDEVIQGIIQYFTRYWHMKIINKTPAPNSVTQQRIKEVGEDVANPFCKYYNIGEAKFNIKLETDNEHDGITYDISCKICVENLMGSKPFYKKNKITINLDIDGTIPGSKNRTGQRDFLFLKLLTIERFNISLPYPINKGITSFMNEMKNKGFQIIFKICPGFSKINPNLISKGIDLGNISRLYIEGIKEFNQFALKIIPNFIYYNDDSTIMKWWSKISGTPDAIKIIEVVSKDRYVYDRFRSIIGDDLSDIAKDMYNSGFVD